MKGRSDGVNGDSEGVVGNSGVVEGASSDVIEETIQNKVTDLQEGDMEHVAEEDLYLYCVCQQVHSSGR